MLITPKSERAFADDAAASGDASEPPPAYDSAESKEVGAEATPPTPLQKSTKYVKISKDSGSIKGSWIIDRDLSIPAPLRASSLGEPEHNLFLKTACGAIQADVTVVPCIDNSEVKQSVMIEAYTNSGSIKMNLHDGASQFRSRTARPPVKSTLHSDCGAIRIRVPRTFRGIISAMSLCGSVRLSEEVKAQVHFSQDDNRRRRFFVGEFDDKDLVLETWAGDEMDAVSKCGSIHVSYDDEDEYGGNCAVM